jgi:GNAT superfamily N-acetyltransferase
MTTQIPEYKLAALAGQHKLFVRDWQMESLYDYIYEGDHHLGIHLIIENEIPVASCVVDKDEGILNVFVKEEYRSKKYGQRVVEETLTKYNLDKSEVYGSEGVEGSEKFYNSCGIAYFKTGYLSMTREESKMYIENMLTMKDIRKKRVEDYWKDKQSKTSKLKF